jgi:exosortase
MEPMTAHETRSVTSDSGSALPSGSPAAAVVTLTGVAANVPAGEGATASTAPAAAAPAQGGTPPAGTLVTLGVLLAAFTVGMWPSLVSLNDRWILFDEAYSHGYLVIAMVGYFLWLQVDRLRRIEPRPAPAWAIVVAGLSVAWALSMVVDVELGGMVLLPLVLLGMVLVTRGWETTRVVAFPILLMYVAIPVWEDFFGEPLRKTTAIVSGEFLKSFATFPVLVEGYSISVPGGTFFVADACSGLAFFLTGITIGLAYGYLNIEGVARRSAFLLICVALSIVSNWVRVTSLVYIGHYTDMQSSLVTEGHLLYGWCIFAAVMVLMLAIGYRMSAPLPADAEPVEPAPPLPAFAPVAVAVAVLAVLLAPALTWGYRQASPDAVPAPAMPLQFAATSADQLPWRGYFRGTPEFVAGTLRDDPALGLLFVHYDRQVQGDEVVNDLNKLDNERAWTLQGNRTLTSADVATLPHALTESELVGRGGSRLLVWHWKSLGGHPSMGRLSGKLAQLQAMLLDGRPDGTFTALMLRCEAECDSARVRMRELAPGVLPGIASALSTSR